jgi:hypothetical protein
MDGMGDIYDTSGCWDVTLGNRDNEGCFVDEKG